MRAFIFLTFGILSLSFASNAQKHYLSEIDSLNKELSYAHDTLKVKILDQLVRKCFSANENAQMYSFLNELERLSHTLKSYDGLFKTAYYHGLIQFNIEWQPSKALKNLHVALKLGKDFNIDDPETYSAIYNNLGLIHKNVENYDSAFFFYKKAAQINSLHNLDRKNVTLLLNMTRISYVMGRISLAGKYAEKCLNEGIKTKDDAMVCIGYKTMAEFLYYKGSIDLGLEYCKKALDLSINIYGKNHSNTASVINLILKLYNRLGDYHQSLKYARLEYQYLQKIYGLSAHPKMSGTFLSLGRCYAKLNSFDSAKYYYKKALQCTELVPIKKNSTKLIIYNLLAKCHLNENNLTASMKYLKSAMDINVDNIGQKAETRKLLGDLYFMAKDYPQSLKEYQNSLLIRAGRPLTGKYSNPATRQINDHIRGLLLMQRIAEVRLSLYENSNNKEHLDASLEAYQICDSLGTTFTLSFKHDEDKMLFNNAMVHVYKDGMKLANKMFNINNRSKYREMAFHFAEKAKSNLLYQSIAKHNAMRYGMLPDSVLNHEESLKGKIAFYISRINKESEGAKKKGYKNRLFEAKREYENFQQNLETTYPRYYRLKYNNDFLTLSEIQSRLNDETIIEYVLTDDSIYIFLIKRDTAQILELARPDELDLWLDGFRSSILSKEHGQYQEVAYHLYESLFRPVEQFLTKDDHVIIVPDGKLWHLNFDLLITRKPAEKPFYDLDYLIRKYTISYANSANHLFMNVDLPESNSTKKCLAFSYSSDSVAASSMDFLVLRDFKHDLPGTREEIRSISKLFPGKYYFGSLASEGNFKRESQHYSILHLALHGEVSDTDPLYSKLKFSPANNDSTEDGYLNIYEIYNMNLNSELAVLSACNTGYGKLEKGEGLMSLGRAFQYAGVNSLLLSNWGVPDEVAPSLMYDFYRYLKQGMKKSEALRNAKLNYLKTAGIHKSAPFYWGSFVVIGDTSPIEIDGGKPKSWIFALSSIFFFAMVLWVSNHRPVKHLF